MSVKCEVESCKYNVCCLKGSDCKTNEYVCSRDNITIGYGDKNGEWVFAECMDYVKGTQEETIRQSQK